jgi:chemotaxis protein methyltransferase CheR
MTHAAQTILTSAPEPVSISQEEYLKFCEFFYRKTGIFFEESKRYFVDRRLQERMVVTASESFRDYFMTLRFQVSGEELQTLINAMTVNETYFYREDYQFRCLVNSLLNELAHYKEVGDPIRIWSIPCSTGEEPYSIAMHILEDWPLLERFDVEIWASDIDSQVLERARRGVFNKRSVHGLPATLLNKYFTQQGANYQICQTLRDSVRFELVNLNDALQTRCYRGFDVIFCRNLLIYFDDVSRRQAAATFFDALNPGGFIGLGHSESMSRISSLFRVRRFAEGIFYQKEQDA